MSHLVCPHCRTRFRLVPDKLEIAPPPGVPVELATVVSEADTRAERDARSGWHEPRKKGSRKRAPSQTVTINADIIAELARAEQEAVALRKRQYDIAAEAEEAVQRLRKASDRVRLAIEEEEEHRGVKK